VTNEELENAVDFITRQQVSTAEMIAALARNQVEHAKRLMSLEESNQLLIRLVGDIDARLDRGDTRDEKLEEAFQTIANISARQDERIRSLEGM
jgi:GAF domain-containing protein